MHDTIRLARFPEDTDAVLDIWHEYIASPQVSLDFQDNAAEFASLPGKYAQPSGAILLVERDGAVAGCVALRPVNARIGEIKRLYLRPIARGRGLGRALVERVIEQAREAGYAELRLDVLAEFTAARALYADLGFTPAEPVAHNPVPDTAFLGLRLG